MLVKDKFVRWFAASEKFLANETRIERLEQELRGAMKLRKELQQNAVALYEHGFEIKRDEIGV